jgi:hypothetical protein
LYRGSWRELGAPGVAAGFAPTPLDHDRPMLTGMVKVLVPDLADVNRI